MAIPETAPVTTGATLAVMTYNILVGGSAVNEQGDRISLIEQVIDSLQPDIVGMQEVNEPEAVFAMARRLGLEARIARVASGFHVGILSRWPIRAWRQYERPIFQKTLIEAEIEVPGESAPWHCFVSHLTADFSKGWAAERRRVAEVRTIIACMAEARRLGRRHLLMGDFNTLAPGERFDLVGLIERVIALDDQRRQTNQAMPGQPQLGLIIPPLLHPFMPLIRRVPTTPWLASAATFAASLAIPRLVYAELADAGYHECLRQRTGDPRLIPPTCPLPAPAGRIDYLWASPDLADRLCGCEVVSDGPGRPVMRASDHAPVLGRFALAPEAIAMHDAQTQLAGALGE